MSIVARGLSFCRRWISRSTVAGEARSVFEMTRRSARIDLLARFGSAVERGFAVDRIDHGQHQVDMEFAAERAIG